MFLTLHEIDVYSLKIKSLIDINFGAVKYYRIEEYYTTEKKDKKISLVRIIFLISEKTGLYVKETPEEIRKMLNADPTKVQLKKLGVDIDLPDVDTNEL